jgi:hypothetical protein
MKKYSDNGIILGANSPLFVSFFNSKDRDILTHFSCVAAKHKRKIVPQKLKKQRNIILDSNISFDTVIVVLDIVELRHSVGELIDQLKSLQLTTKSRVYIVTPKSNDFNTILNKKKQLGDNLLINNIISHLTYYLLQKNVFSIDFIYYYNLISRDAVYLDYVKNTLYYNEVGYETLFSDASQIVNYTYTIAKLPYPKAYGVDDVKTKIHKVITGSDRNNKYKVRADKTDNGSFVALTKEQVLTPYKVQFDWAKTKLLFYNFDLI